LILAKRRYKTENLVALASDRLSVDILRPEIAAIFIYLRCVDEVGILEKVAGQFHSTWPYYHQRNFLLATSESSKEALKQVVEHLGPKLKGTASRARSHFMENMPIAERERTPMLKIYDEISPYD